MNEAGRVVACPSCSTGYFLPAELIGSRGARIRCPGCGHSFVVHPNEAADAAVAAENLEAASAGTPGDAGPPPAGSASPPARTAPEPPSRNVETHPEERKAGIPDSSQAALARAALETLAGQFGESAERAVAEGRLFARHGPEIMASFDAWRREVGREADPAVFRAALRERWGVDFE